MFLLRVRLIITKKFELQSFVLIRKQFIAYFYPTSKIKHYTFQKVESRNSFILSFLIVKTKGLGTIFTIVSKKKELLFLLKKCYIIYKFYGCKKIINISYFYRSLACCSCFSCSNSLFFRSTYSNAIYSTITQIIQP